MGDWSSHDELAALRDCVRPGKTDLLLWQLQIVP